MMPTETIGLVMEKMRKSVSCAIGALAVGLCFPTASNQPILPRRATSTVAPGSVPLSTSRLNASDSFCSRALESPIASGLASGKGGVSGADVLRAALCAFMVSPVALVAWDASVTQKELNEQGGLTASPLQFGHGLCLKRREPAATPGSLQECSSIGRAPVSKTGGRRFEPCHSCHLFKYLAPNRFRAARWERFDLWPRKGSQRRRGAGRPHRAPRGVPARAARHRTPATSLARAVRIIRTTVTAAISTWRRPIAGWRPGAAALDVQAIQSARGRTDNPSAAVRIRPAGPRHWPAAHIRIVTNGFFLHRHPELPAALAAAGNTDLWLSVHHDDPAYTERLRPVRELLANWQREHGTAIDIRPSHARWTRRYRGFGGDMLPFEDGRPRESWKICPAKWCKQLIDGKIWKCAPLAYLGMQKAKYELSEKWDPYLRYRPLDPSCSDRELDEFLALEDEPACSMCSAERRRFTLPNPMRNAPGILCPPNTPSRESRTDLPIEPQQQSLRCRGECDRESSGMPSQGMQEMTDGLSQRALAAAA